MPRIPYVDISAQWSEDREELLPKIDAMLSRGQHVGGEEIEQFEHAIAEFCRTTHAVAVNSGTDALVLGMRALGIGSGDEVITPPNSFIASTSSIVQVGARPVFVDVLPDRNMDPALLEAAITSRTRAVMPVHLEGRMCDMGAIMKVASKHGLAVVEDAAQSIGSQWKNSPSGSMGNIGCFSAHPLKNLNACGDGGFIVTSDEALAREIRSLRNLGLVTRDRVESFGQVSRMDTLQALILHHRLGKLSEIIKIRRHHAALYQGMLDQNNVFWVNEPDEMGHSYHTFVVQVDRRDEMRTHMLDFGIETAVHYPVPIHLQPAAESLGYGEGDFPKTENQASRVLTLPLHQALTERDICYASETINNFLNP